MNTLGFRSSKGFTLIELLVAIGIIGMLAAIAIPQYALYRKRSFEARSKSDLRNVATAEEAYFIDNQAYKSCSNTGCVNALPSVISLSQGVTLEITATATGFTGSASHPQLTANCLWDSSQVGFMGCS